MFWHTLDGNTNCMTMLHKLANMISVRCYYRKLLYLESSIVPITSIDLCTSCRPIYGCFKDLKILSKSEIPSPLSPGTPQSDLVASFSTGTVELAVLAGILLFLYLPSKEMLNICQYFPILVGNYWCIYWGAISVFNSYSYFASLIVMRFFSNPWNMIETVLRCSPK